MRAMPGNPYDGHALHEALEQVEIPTGRRPDMHSSIAATAAMASRPSRSSSAVRGAASPGRSRNCFNDEVPSSR